MWEAIIGAVVGIGTSIYGFVQSKFDAEKGQIIQIVNDYAYNKGYSIDQIYDLYPKLYNKHRQFFEEQYHFAIEKREHDLSHKAEVVSETKKILLLVVIALMIYFITE